MSRRRTVHIAVDVNSGVAQALSVRLSKRWMAKHFFTYAVYGFILVLLATWSTLVFNGFASSVSAYPATCLGGWEHTKHAEGVPETSRGDVFSKENASYLEPGVASQIFCSDFVAEIPPDTTPTTLTLKLFAALESPHSAILEERDATSTQPSPEENSEPVIEPVIEEDAPPRVELPGSTIDIPEPSPEETLLPLSEPLESSTPSLPQENPPEQPLSFFQVRHARVAVADERVPVLSEAVEVSESIPATEEVVVPDVVDPEEVLGEPTETGSEVEHVEQREADTDVATSSLDVFEETASTTEGVATTSEESSEVLGVTTGPVFTEPLFEVSVTLDGVEWHTLGTLSGSALSSATFSIPIPEGFDWSLLHSIEVAVKSIPSVSAAPGVFIDGMELVFEYENVTTLVSDVGGLSTETAEGDVTPVPESVLSVAPLLVPGAREHEPERHMVQHEGKFWLALSPEACPAHASSAREACFTVASDATAEFQNIIGINSAHVVPYTHTVVSFRFFPEWIGEPSVGFVLQWRSSEGVFEQLTLSLDTESEGGYTAHLYGADQGIVFRALPLNTWSTFSIHVDTLSKQARIRVNGEPWSDFIAWKYPEEEIGALWVRGVVEEPHRFFVSPFTAVPY